MKAETAKYMLTEGVTNINRNKLMSLASVSIVAATLQVFGIFYICVVNIAANTAVLRDEPEIYMECYPNADAKTLEAVEKYLQQEERIALYEKLTKADAMARLKEILGEKDSSILEGLDESFLPVAYRIKLNDPEDSQNMADDLRKVTGVEIVEFSGDTISFRIRILSWIQAASAIMILILMLNSILIISNTIKITVFARRKEIGIMKHIGATDWFIRWPFLVEGAIIGLLGAIASFFVVTYAYSVIVTRFNTDMQLISSQVFNFISLVKPGQIALKLLLSYVIIGEAIGILGSYISIRKHLVE
ncbi:MAG TPA: ABC transporter permease [Clostridiales bacterium]|nr:ABC transporter permease [Clostridiales bacterium]